MAKLNVSDVQHFCVGDGAGIRTTVFLKGCPLRCPWCHNPETLSSEPQTLRFAESGEERRCGRMTDVSELVPELLADRDFYSESGGGVTVSGGEPLLQASAVAQLAKRLFAEGVTTLIDTAGSVPFAAFETVDPFVAGYLFDYKTDSAQKYAAIGGDRELVAGNLRRLIAAGRNVRVRVPLIPGFNDGEDSLRAIADALCNAGAARVDLLPFHRMGSAKYAALGKSYAYAHVEAPSKARVEEIRAFFAKRFETSVE